MKLFSCPACGQRLYFENSRCLACGRSLLYAPRRAEFLLADAPGAYSCLNASECACNWAADQEGGFCCACILNRTIPNLGIAGNRDRWIAIEGAKKRLVYTLLAFRLPVGPKARVGDEIGLAFDLIENDPNLPGVVRTGHDHGLITINVAEADPAERERMRQEMGENYRTLLGHFRHEVGHYYWDRLIRDSPRLDRFRAVFGDERADYAAALKRHYDQGPSQGWQENYISFYAASHPWEDWAETWAHYLHISDTLEMVDSLNIPLARIDTQRGEELAQDIARQDDTSGQRPEPFEHVLAHWLALSEAANSINRCMGLQDFYPFVISRPVQKKLAFVHEVLTEQRSVGMQKAAAA